MNAPIAAAVSAIKSAEVDVAALLAAGAALADPKKNPESDGATYAVVPEGYRLEELPRDAVPQRPRARVKLRDARSFIQYFKEHQLSQSRVYALLKPASFVAVFDDFHPSDAEDRQSATCHDQSAWREYRAEFAVPASPEWDTWTKKDRQKMNQLEFAEFLLDNMPDVVKPSGSELYDAALSFEASSSGSFVATQRLQDGSHNLQWRSDTNTTGTVKLPDQIELSIPVFENEAPVAISARLRYRVTGDKLAIWYELVRPHKTLDAAFRVLWDRVQEGCGLQLLLGSPE